MQSVNSLVKLAGEDEAFAALVELPARRFPIVP